MNTRGHSSKSAEFMRPRRDALRECMKQMDLDVILLTSPQSIYYYCGFESTGYYLLHALLVTADGCALVLRDFEIGPAHFGESSQDRLFVWTSTLPFGEALREAVRAYLPDGAIRCGYEGLSNFCPPVLLDHARSIPELDLVQLGSEIDRLRQKKAAAEIACSERAGHYAVAAMDAGMKALRPGCTEIEIGTIMLNEMVRSGGDIPASFPYAYFSAKSWNRMQPPSRRNLTAGDVAYLECGAMSSRYGGALLRTAVAGKPAEALKAAYDAARCAFESMERALVPGAVSGDVDAKATSALQSGGYDKYRLLKGGYSIGVGFAPGWGEINVFDISTGNRALVEENAVLHLVMVLMIPEIGAIGLSETMHVTADGARSLTPFSRDLQII